jgi:hypothetical protein
VLLLLISANFCIGVVQAQDRQMPDDQGSTSERAEASEDAHRRRMELEGSRDRDTFTNTTYTSQAGQEKIDKLPKESRDNIRNQLTDIIIDNGQWEPFDALREYPYEPSEAAQEDPVLSEREKEAWAEQVEKYHQREASAYEANRPMMPGSDAQQPGTSPGPSSPPGQSQGEGEQQGEGQEGEGEPQGDEGQQGSQGSSSSSSSASSYEPYQPQLTDDEDEISTAGVSQSALDFLKRRQGQNSGSAGQAASAEEAMEQNDMFSQVNNSAEDGAEDEATPSQQSSQDSPQPSESEFIIPGTIAIKDLDKLEGMAAPIDDSEDPQD